MRKYLFVLLLLPPLILFGNPVIAEIYFTKSTDGGVNWPDSCSIVGGNEEGVLDYPPALDVRSSNRYYTIWATENGRIRSSFSHNGGSWWGGDWYSPVDDWTSSYKYSPVLVTDTAGIVYAVWEDTRGNSIDIYFAKSSDNGHTWTDPNIIVNDSLISACRFPSIAVGPMSDIYVVWQDNRGGKWDIYFTESTNGGWDWQHPDICITDSLEGSHITPVLKMCNNTLYIAWVNESFLSNSYNIYFGKSMDCGQTWMKKTINNVDTHEMGLPSMDVSDSIIGVTWQEERSGESHIFFSGSTDGGLDWSSDTQVDDGTVGGKYHPSVGIDDLGDVHVAWDDERNGHSQIYFAKSEDEGSTWTTPNMLIGDYDYGSYQDIMPSLAIDSGEICVTWQLEGTIIIGVEERTSPFLLSAISIYPNPTSLSFAISYTLQRDEEISIVLYDVSGRLIDEITSGEKRKGTHIIYWDREDRFGKYVKRGVYFLHVKTSNKYIRKKVVLL